MGGTLPMTFKKAETGDLLRDTLNMLILKTLSHGEMHGYDIAEYIHETSDEVLGVEEGACIRRYIAWKFADCSRQSGARPTTTGGRNTTG